MNNTRNPKLTENSKVLRKNMTKEEKHLWYDFFKKIPITVNRQKIIGKYIVDFYIASSKTVIELDGSQHYEEDGMESDKKRDDFLKGLGIKVLRYSNLDINRRFKSVCEDILLNINTSVSEDTANFADTSSVSRCSTASPQGEASGGRLPPIR